MAAATAADAPLPAAAMGANADTLRMTRVVGANPAMVMMMATRPDAWVREVGRRSSNCWRTTTREMTMAP